MNHLFLLKKAWAVAFSNRQLFWAGFWSFRLFNALLLFGALFWLLLLRLAPNSADGSGLAHWFSQAIQTFWKLPTIEVNQAHLLWLMFILLFGVTVIGRLSRIRMIESIRQQAGQLVVSVPSQAPPAHIWRRLALVDLATLALGWGGLANILLGTVVLVGLGLPSFAVLFVVITFFLWLFTISYALVIMRWAEYAVMITSQTVGGAFVLGLELVRHAGGELFFAWGVNLLGQGLFLLLSLPIVFFFIVPTLTTILTGQATLTHWFIFGLSGVVWLGLAAIIRVWLASYLVLTFLVLNQSVEVEVI